MNSHLNIFKSYAKVNRSYQLENDLTRALAISLQEDTLFFHEVLKEILKDSNFYDQLFESSESAANLNISIQTKASKISNFEHIFAISLSEYSMSDFWAQEHNKNYDPICDLVIQINNIVLVFEAKRDNVDCTAQLYNQILNITRTENEQLVFNKENYGKSITPFDLSWPRLMTIAVKVYNFERTVNIQNRFLSDFIDLIKQHNFRWLPEPCIAALQAHDKFSILRRLESAIVEIDKNNEIKKLNYNDRLGFELDKHWAKEILMDIDENGSLLVSIYPGNTKGQGYSLFEKNPSFCDMLNIFEDKYKTKYNYHIKFSSFQKYFQGLWFSEAKLKKPLYTRENFFKYAGRKHRGDQWEQISSLFDEHLNYDWRKQCDWNNSVLLSGRNQFDISFGYKVSIAIPFQNLKSLDPKQSELNSLINFLIEIHHRFSNDLLI